MLGLFAPYHRTHGFFGVVIIMVVNNSKGKEIYLLSALRSTNSFVKLNLRLRSLLYGNHEHLHKKDALPRFSPDQN